jgi:hypothetical protein
MLAAARDALAPGEPLDAFVLAQATDPDVAAARTATLRRDAAPFDWPRWEVGAADRLREAGGRESNSEARAGGSQGDSS